MLNLIQIARGWYNFAHGGAKIQQLMYKRLAICDSCPFKVQVNVVGQILIQLINEEGSVFQCGKCNCPLAAKTAVPEQSCPVGKWGPDKDESYF